MACKLKIINLIFLCFLLFAPFNYTNAAEISVPDNKENHVQEDSDKQEDAGVKLNMSSVAVDGYLGPANDPNVVYIKISVPLETFFQILTNVSKDGKAVFVCPTYTMTNSGPDPIKVSVEGIYNGSEPGYEKTTSIELDPNASQEDQLSGRLKIGLFTIDNWINSNRTSRPSDVFPTYILDSVINPHPNTTIGYIDGASYLEDPSKLSATYKYNLLWDTLKTNQYSGIQKQTYFSIKFKFASVNLTSD